MRTPAVLPRPGAYFMRGCGSENRGASNSPGPAAPAPPARRAPSTTSRPTMASAAQSAPLTSTSGWSAATMSCGVSSSKIDDRVDRSRAPPAPRRVRARASIGRSGPLFSARTERSELTADDQHVALGAGVLQVADVAGVQQVEDAVGEDDRLPARRAAAAQRPRRRGGQDHRLALLRPRSASARAGRRGIGCWA